MSPYVVFKGTGKFEFPTTIRRLDRNASLTPIAPVVELRVAGSTQTHAEARRALAGLSLAGALPRLCLAYLEALLSVARALSDGG